MVTLKDVAAAANVSMITVSRVINNPDKVKPETRKKIEKIMKELSYIPNSAAKNLATNRAGVIDVYIPESIDLSNPFVMHFIAGISEILSKQMYSFLILRNMKNEHICDGYIVTGLLKNEIYDFYDYAHSYNRPIALFGHTDLPDVDCIDVDNIAGAEMATQYLIDMGHTQLAMINVEEDKDYTFDRLAGFQKAAKMHNLKTENMQILSTPNNVKGGYTAAKKLLKDREFTGVFCATDTIALGVSLAIVEEGLAIPKDISIIGFDGLGHQFLTTPKLTTIQQPIFKIGSMLAQTLINRLNGEKKRIYKFIEPKLIIGNSVAKRLAFNANPSHSNNIER